MVELSVIALQFPRQDPARFARLAMIGLSRSCSGLDGRVCQLNYAAKLSSCPRNLRETAGNFRISAKEGKTFGLLSLSAVKPKDDTDTLASEDPLGAVIRTRFRRELSDWSANAGGTQVEDRAATRA